MDRKALVLVVDDDRSARLIMKKALAQTAFTVIEAENGLQALNALEKHQPDLVLLDVNMPELDGFEACRRFAWRLMFLGGYTGEKMMQQMSRFVT